MPFCTQCGLELTDSMRFCHRCGTATFKDTSQQREDSDVPDEIKGWNWGAFFLSWIWGISNKVWIALLTLILPVSFVPIMYLLVDGVSSKVVNLTLILFVSLFFIVSIVLGIKGNEWAWKNKKWDSIEHFKRTQRTWAMVGTRLTLTTWFLFFGIVVYSNTLGFPEYRAEAYETELANIQGAVTAMMADQGLSTLTSPQTIATNNLSDFPTANADNATYEYVLYRENRTANYIMTQFTQGTYIVDAKGTVTQVTTGDTGDDRPVEPMEVFLLVGLIIWLGVEIFSLAYRIRIKKKLSKEIGWWKSTGNIVYQLYAILWTALLFFAIRPWPFSDFSEYNISTLSTVIILVIVLGIAIADGLVIYKVTRE